MKYRTHKRVVVSDTLIEYRFKAHPENLNGKWQLLGKKLKKMLQMKPLFVKIVLRILETEKKYGKDV